MAPSLLLAALSCTLASSAAAIAPFDVRVDAHLLDAALPAAFVPLPPSLPFGAPDAMAVTWALPTECATQLAARVVITRPVDASGARAPATVYDSGLVAGAAQAASVPRERLAYTTGYDIAVQVRFAPAGSNSTPSLSELSAPARFVTSADALTWAAPNSAPVWAAPCGGENSSFALFRAAAPLALPPGADGVLQALLYVTASPPIYDDSTLTTKLLGGFKLRLGAGDAARALVGVGPGRTSCGPAPTHKDSVCALTQPVDGFDVRPFAEAALAARVPLAVELEAYAVEQPQYNISRAVQAVLVVRYSPEGVAPDSVFGTNAGAGSGWLSLAANAMFNPGSNKDSGWYLQPEENVQLSCLPDTTSAAGPAAACSSSHTQCAWAPPVVAPLAFASGALPLQAKAGRALEVRAGLPPVAATRLGPGWWLLDSGAEFQGGFELQLNASSHPSGSVVAVVQLSDELQANGSAMWNSRAGMHYRDTWLFPPTATARLEQLAFSHHEFSEFRYAELILTDAASGAPLDLDPSSQFTASFWRVRYAYDEARAAVVATTSADLDRVFAFASATLRATSIDLYADSNTRQRSIDCMADDVVAALNQYSTTSELALPRAMSAQLMAIGPAGYISPVWADWTVLPGLSSFYDALYSGDLTFAAPLFDSLAYNHTYFSAINASSGLVEGVSGLSALIDTSGGSDDGFRESPTNAVVQAWSYLGLRSFAQLGRWIGRGDDAARLDAAADAMRAGVRALLLNDSSVGSAAVAVCDGRCAATPHLSVHSTFYALYSGLFADDDALTTRLAAYVRARAAEDTVLGVPCGAYPVQFLLYALYADGYDHGNAAFAVLTAQTKHSWLHMMEVLGATATMECWLPEELPNLSFSHVWSSSPAIIVPQQFFGVNPTSPGFATFDVRPQPGPVLQGRATLPTVRGPITVSFAQSLPSAGCFDLSLVVPGGSVARAFVPRYGATVSVKVDGVAVSAAVEGDFAWVGVPSGAHSITSC